MNDKKNLNDDTSSSTDPKDGFDLIEYPVDYNFKAMCRSQEGHPAVDYISALLAPMLNDGALLNLSSNSSRTGKFESVTVIVRLNNRNELESIYRLIADAPRVVMTL